jgi:chitinase
MAYDYAGSWDANAGHQANWDPSSSNPTSTPFSTSKAINDYTAAGINPANIVLGMPLYGRSFQNTDGPGTPFSGIGQGTWEAGVYDYKQLPVSGCEEHTDKTVTASWCYDPAKRFMVSYDTPDVIAMKTQFIRERGLGGGMWWESSSDKKGDASLISTVRGSSTSPRCIVSAVGLVGDRWTDTSIQFVKNVGGIGSLDQTNNLLSYPASKYQNLREGMLNN